jgi:1,4-alpha-glucan branching enzyme
MIRSIEERVGELATMSPARLRAEWERIYRKPPPQLSTDLLRRAIAWRVQEKNAQGLSAAVERELSALVRAGPAPIAETSRRETMRPGTQLIRSWRGTTYVVVATESGFIFNGRDYESLTAIAREITGAAWSGPRFFGLRSKQVSREK